MEHPTTEDLEVLLRLRACLLEKLYQFFREIPYGAMELGQLETHCRTDTQTLNWNLVYLEMCGYVELGRGVEAWPHVAFSANITAAGIELVEDTRRFRARFGHPTASTAKSTR